MEAPKWSGVFKYVTPQPDAVAMTDNMTLDSAAYNNYSWYQRLVHGSSSRLTKYQEFDTMDQDVDIARALDLVAEEMTNVNSKTGLPLDLNLTNDPSISIPHNIVATLRIALQHWCRVRGFQTRLFSIARNTIKQGDAFFIRRHGGTSKEYWEYTSGKNVLAAYVDSEDVSKIIAWQIRVENKKPKTNIAVNNATIQGGQPYETELIPVGEVVRFSLNDDMSDQAPFGQSVLSSVYRVQKQKELLEDAIVIYRVQRAPERRVFYIDVGKMPPQRTKQYLEQIKNEIRQKKVPSVSGGVANVDSTYNPQSMSEDFFFPSRPNGNNTRVETLAGGQNLGELTDLEYFRQKVLEGLRIPPSYLPNFQSTESATFSDGNVGVAYMPEIQFYKYIRRLQYNLNQVIDEEFKKFLHNIDLNIDPTIFNITLPEPTNFEMYKQAAVDSTLLSQFGNADGVSYLAKRFILQRYLGLTPSEIATNEHLLAQERGFKSAHPNMNVQLYNPDLITGGDESLGGPSGVGGFGGTSMGQLSKDNDDKNLDLDSNSEQNDDMQVDMGDNDINQSMLNQSKRT